MSVLIKSMKIPTSCSDCKIRLSVGCCGNLPQNTRMPNCPLAPVPKHGRLIDADALLNLLNHCMFPSDMVTTRAVSMATNWIKEAPTILEAEEDRHDL